MRPPTRDGVAADRTAVNRGYCSFVLDGATGKPCFTGKPHRLGNVGGVVAETVFKIARDRQRRRSNDLFGMMKSLITGHVPHVRAAQREGEAGAGGG